MSETKSVPCSQAFRCSEKTTCEGKIDQSKLTGDIPIGCANFTSLRQIPTKRNSGWTVGQSANNNGYWQI